MLVFKRENRKKEDINEKNYFYYAKERSFHIVGNLAWPTSETSNTCKHNFVFKRKNEGK